jgi:hypothetical protein
MSGWKLNDAAAQLSFHGERKLVLEDDGVERGWFDAE